MRREMLLLENQLPFIVLEGLFEIASPLNDSLTEPPIPFNDFVTPYLTLSFEVQPLSSVKGKHALDSLRNVYLLPSEQYETSSLAPLIFIPCAAHLFESGVVFKKSSSKDRFKITFRDGVIEIPTIEAK
ncbi:hypothetical protein GIB67_028782 [Kingdonia uniflora]|uniref:Uncharacterized protein n=1 Tax=Kingdonia uniflora TaxID=39325 RepID=A0A7J7M241_9MAGN|nr:hypothetical protein GIB67_028782 [Kingdonia uniflora]